MQLPTRKVWAGKRSSTSNGGTVCQAGGLECGVWPRKCTKEVDVVHVALLKSFCGLGVSCIGFLNGTTLYTVVVFLSF